MQRERQQLHECMHAACRLANPELRVAFFECPVFINQSSFMVSVVLRTFTKDTKRELKTESYVAGTTRSFLPSFWSKRHPIPIPCFDTWGLLYKRLTRVPGFRDKPATLCLLPGMSDCIPHASKFGLADARWSASHPAKFSPEIMLSVTNSRTMLA
jgi:hypothetical protein